MSKISQSRKTTVIALKGLQSDRRSLRELANILCHWEFAVVEMGFKSKQLVPEEKVLGFDSGRSYTCHCVDASDPDKPELCCCSIRGTMKRLWNKRGFCEQSVTTVDQPYIIVRPVSHLTEEWVDVTGCLLNAGYRGFEASQVIRSTPPEHPTSDCDYGVLDLLITITFPQGRIMRLPWKERFGLRGDRITPPSHRLFEERMEYWELMRLKGSLSSPDKQDDESGNLSPASETDNSGDREETGTPGKSRSFAYENLGDNAALSFHNRPITAR